MHLLETIATAARVAVIARDVTVRKWELTVAFTVTGEKTAKTNSMIVRIRQRQQQ